MQPRILTRFTVILVFVFNCFLTIHVVANENKLAPNLTPEGWQLLSEIEAYSKGMAPTKVTPGKLAKRQPSVKTELVKRPNSRVKVKFADELQIRLDIHNQPYSRTQRNISVVQDVCSSLGVQLAPTVKLSEERLDAILQKAQIRSRKQQPDIGGIYWLVGDETSVDVAAEMLFAMDEVEWVLYKPVYSKMPDWKKYQENPAKTQVQTHSTQFVSQQAQSAPELYGACIINSNCTENLSESVCNTRGGTFLGNNSICGSRYKKSNRRNNRNNNVGPTGACCMPDNTCTAGSTEADCIAANGWYAGNGSGCGASCPGTGTGECCVINGIGCVIVSTEMLCYTVFNSVFLGDST